ncbi:putative Mediator of RNA polymerase II transcription subunit 7 [Hypsibius exemplaris]|uniref:Mediator of RNA polymerase II transcription subunit 7 n=1 Tax=Hypsibius exemplaris TaxID=2072580 RepID=A0A1W0WZJ0_HYPEX|nr:putative Mediator of RNA polymerase II transcription subunit 7 [Hypsibius exemplaris]
MSLFPKPPEHYFKIYTDEAIHRGRAPLPPPLPVKGGEPFLIFGAPQWNDDYVVRPFESLDIKRLYPQSFDRKRELKKALHSILATFLDLIDVLVKCPRSKKRNDKLEDMNLLFIHFQHLLNEYRVHQARDGVRTMLEVQRRQTLDVTDRLNHQVDKAAEMVALCTTGTAGSDQAQAQFTSALKWDIAHLQARRAAATGPSSASAGTTKQIGRIFDRFMCDLAADADDQEEESTMESSTDWLALTGDQVMLLEGVGSGGMVDESMPGLGGPSEKGIFR